LRGIAGATVFARGEIYQREGQVRILALEPGRALSQVAGTDDYRTEITGRGKQVGGACSCRAFDEWGFCKHMVATALAANATGDDAESQGDDALSRVRDHLKQKGVDALVAMIVDLAERVSVLFRKLDLAAPCAARPNKPIMSPR
jgi:uncharacterized Zn finger protein